MIGRILCALRLHDWEEYSMVVGPTHGIVRHVCVRCGRHREWVFP